MTEDDLCRYFAEHFARSDDFKNWVLSRTKFASGRFSTRLLKEEQILARPKVLPDRWWRHWFWKIPELGKEHETDIFLVLENAIDGMRFALHIENKFGGQLGPGQAASYAPRAKHVATNESRIPHQDFATVFIAPSSTMSKNPDDVALFDAAISHEEIAVFIQEFEVFSAPPVK
ncbi:hypothetical protein [Hoeflea sp.]|uniref:hypothetical protein n=1 Tax=unclassified Hoeflea TaxID=2614931 RepID=UPI002B002750|nr:hypothetical protein [Hoeflea sp.]